MSIFKLDKSKDELVRVWIELASENKRLSLTLMSLDASFSCTLDEF